MKIPKIFYNENKVYLGNRTLKQLNLTDLKIPVLFILSIDLFNNKLFNGSPSSTINLFLITSSIV